MDLDGCHCSNWPSLPDDVYLRSQYISDFFIALAYFSIPCELIYFVQKSAIFPYRWVIVQFGAFIVLCGATHAINMFTFTPHSRTVAFIMVISKMLTAIVSCATAVTLVTIIPDLLSVKTRELFLKNKADELDREMGLIRTQAEASQHVRMLTHEIRSTLDRDTILNTTLVELGKTLELEECALWMPAENGLELQLCRTFGTAAHSGRATVPTHHPTITNVFKTSRATSIPPSSPVCMTRPRTGKYIPGEVVAIRVPLLHVESFNIGYWPEAGDVAFALLVLMLPSDSARTWHLHERELVEAVADQVAVALSHAAILEQSIRQRDKLMEQNVKLDMARKEAEMALSSRNDFLAVMDQQMRAPMATIIAASLQLQQTELNAEQRAMVDTVLNNSNLLCTLINDVLDVSRLEDGSLVLDLCSFSISAIFQEVLKLVNPVASLRKLTLSLSLTADLPEYVLGDDKRFMQVALNVVGNAVKFTKEGSVLVSVRLERPEYLRDAHAPEFCPLQGDRHCFIRVEVQDTGIGISPSDIPMLFNKFIQAGGRRNAGTGLGLAISKRLVNLMDGHIWIESEGLGKGTTVIYIVKLSLPDSNRNEQRVSGLSPQQRVEFTGTPVLVADDNGANRMVTRGLLVRLGCQVTVASSGSECLQILSQVSRGFRIVLLDIYMPKMDGFGTAVRIQEMLTNRSSAKLGAKPPLLVALASGTSDRQLIDKCRNAGMKGLIMKPISYEKLQTALSQLLQKGSYFDIY